MKCIDKKCEFRELNGGDESSDFYFCKYCGIDVDRGESECVIDIWESEAIEEDDCPCNTCVSKDNCDSWDARFCCTLCYYYSDDPDCENCDPRDI